MAVGGHRRFVGQYRPLFLSALYLSARLVAAHTDGFAADEKTRNTL